MIRGVNLTSCGRISSYHVSSFRAYHFAHICNLVGGVGGGGESWGSEGEWGELGGKGKRESEREGEGAECKEYPRSQGLKPCRVRFAKTVPFLAGSPTFYLSYP